MPLVTPPFRPETYDDHAELLGHYGRTFGVMRDLPRQAPEEIAAAKLGRLVELTNYAFLKVPFYRDKYGAAGFRPGDVKTYEEFSRLPTVSKDELIDFWSDDLGTNRTLAAGVPLEFKTRSSGSSGRFVTLAQDRAMVIADTLLGVRQFEMQSGGNYRPNDVLAEIYTCEWWFSSVGGLHRRVWISSQAPTEDIWASLRCLRPAMVSTYPSVLRRMLSAGDRLSDLGARLVVVHSEQSRRAERDDLARLAGVPVLDEYSSEELTRIALECPHHRYHVEEDTVHLEVTNVSTGRPVPPGEQGEVIGTSLLNRAMPLIRYRQGDFAALSKGAPCACGSNFNTLDALEGRMMDFFVTPGGRVVTSGQLMDAAYLWHLNLGIPVHGLEYRMIQHAHDRVEILIRPGLGFEASMTAIARRPIEDLLGPGVVVEVRLVDAFPSASGPKTRLIEARVGGRPPSW